MSGSNRLKWEPEGYGDWKAVTSSGVYRCIRNFNDMSVLWFNDERLGVYGGGSHLQSKAAAEAHAIAAENPHAPVDGA